MSTEDMKPNWLLERTQNDVAVMVLTFYFASYFTQAGKEQRSHKTEIRSTSLAIAVILFLIHHCE